MCQLSLAGGMNALFAVEKCPERGLRKVKHNDHSTDGEEGSDEDYEYMFNTVNIQHKKPQVQVRSSRGQMSHTWMHFIAAEEVTWNYAPHLKPTDR